MSDSTTSDADSFVSADAKTELLRCQSPDCANTRYYAKSGNTGSTRNAPTTNFGEFCSIARSLEMSKSSPTPTKDFEADHIASPSPTTSESRLPRCLIAVLRLLHLQSFWILLDLWIISFSKRSSKYGNCSTVTVFYSTTCYYIRSSFEL